MSIQTHNPLRQSNGFTLLEVVIVIVVIGILAVLIIPGVTSGPQRKRDVQRKSDLNNIKTALEAYYNDNNFYPPAGGPSCTPSDDKCLTTILTTGPTPATKKIPNDPKSGRDYGYSPSPSGCASGACTSYSLTAKLENTKDPDAKGGVYTLESAN